MRRLTERDENGYAYYPKCLETPCDGGGHSARCDGCELSYQICEKLADYEDEAAQEKAKEKELRRAVKLAATVMQAAGLCRYDDIDKCKRICPTNDACRKCIERWLLDKARL